MTLAIVTPVGPNRGHFKLAVRIYRNLSLFLYSIFVRMSTALLHIYPRSAGSPHIVCRYANALNFRPTPFARAIPFPALRSC